MLAKLIQSLRRVCLPGLLVLSACGGKNIHSNLTEDSRVLVRRWTLQTRPNSGYMPGERQLDFSNPIMTEDTLVFGNQSVGLVSLYPKLEQQRWVLPIKNGVISELAADKSNVFFGGGDGYFYSVSLDTGRVNWRYEIRNPILSEPALSAGRVFVTTTDDTVYAFDAGTGKWLWHYRRRSSQSATILGASSPLVDGNEVITGLSDGFLVALGINDGQLKWERKLHQGTKFTDVDAHPVLDEGVLYVPSYDGALYALKRQGGAVLWRFDAGGAKRVAVEGDRLYFPSTDGSIYSLEKATGKQIWRFELDGGVPTRLSVSDRYLIVASSYQYLYVIDKQTGQGVYRFNAGDGSGFLGSPGFDAANGRIYLLSQYGNLYAFELRKPRHRELPHSVSDPYLFIDY